MPINLRIEGDVHRLIAVGNALKAAEAKTQKRELAKAIQRATKPIKEEIKQSARDALPHGGGLNEWVAAIGIKTHQAYSGNYPGVQIRGTLDNKSTVRRTTTFGPLREGEKRTKTTKSRRRGTFGAQADLRDLNRGRIMHPTWGHGPLVGPQFVTPGFWDRPLTGVTARRARKEILAAVKQTAAAIAAESGGRAA